MLGLPPHKRPVNMVFQRYALFPHLDVFENIAFGLRLRHVRDAEITRKANSMLDLVGLPGFGRRQPAGLSGGEAQRVALARALVMEPKVLLLDEPLGALDLKIRQQMQIELQRIHDALGATFLHVTHDQGEALTMSDRVVIMNQGRIVQIGTPREVYTRPVSVFCADFVGQSNILTGRVLQTSRNHALVGVSGATITARTRQQVREGQQVSIVIRPEAIVMGEPTKLRQYENVLDGRVSTVIFLGSCAWYHINVGRGVVLTAEIRGQQGPPAFRRGEPVSVGWSSMDTLVLTD